MGVQLDQGIGPAISETAQESPKIDKYISELLDPSNFPDDDGTRPSTADVVIERSAHANASRGYSALGFNETFDYPRMNLTDAQRGRFLDGLRPIVTKLLNDNPSGEVQGDFLYPATNQRKRASGTGRSSRKPRSSTG